MTTITKTYRVRLRSREKNVHGNYIERACHVTAGNRRGAISQAARHGDLVVSVEDCSRTPYGVTIWRNPDLAE